MNNPIVLVLFILTVQAVRAQTADSLILELRMINAAVAGPSPAPGNHLLLSNRALNIFFSEAAGYYLSGPDDLTLYKNSVVANAAEGTVSIYHNLRQPAGTDSSIRRFLSIGAQVNAGDAYNASSAGRPYNNQFGFLVKQTWIGRPHVTATPAQIRTMDALRANLLHSIEGEIRRRAAEEDAALAAFDTSTDIPGQDGASAKAIARQNFAATLKQDIEFEYAHSQAETLAQSFNYRVMAFNWTSVSLYVPLVTENFQTMITPGADGIKRHAWPVHLNLTHTRLWEGSAFGRLFVSLAGDLSWNNSRDCFGLIKTGNVYVGDYESFLTPVAKAQIIYFPTNSHIGVSFLARQAIGDYHAADAILGVPIVLINKKAEPAINFEFQVRFYDLGHTIASGTGFNGHTAVGLTVGVPFSKIAF